MQGCGDVPLGIVLDIIGEKEDWWIRNKKEINSDDALKTYKILLRCNRSKERVELLNKYIGKFDERQRNEIYEMETSNENETRDQLKELLQKNGLEEEVELLNLREIIDKSNADFAAKIVIKNIQNGKLSSKNLLRFLRRMESEKKYTIGLKVASIAYEKRENEIHTKLMYGQFLEMNKENNKAIDLYEKIIGEGGTYDEVYLSIARVYTKNYNFTKSLKYAISLIEQERSRENAEQIAISSLYQLGLYEEADKLLKSHKCEIPNVAATRWTSIIAAKQGKLEEAESYARTAVELDPKSSLTRSNLAIILWDQDKASEAIENSLHAMRINLHDSIDVKNNMASIYMDIGKYEECEKLADEIIQTHPCNGNPKFMKAIILMRRNDYVEGWKHYMYREKVGHKYVGGLPEYKGQKKGRLLVVAEQGIGDEITFASIMNELAKNELDITMQCDERLETLFRRSFGNEINYTSRGSEENIENFDFWVYIGDLMQYFRTDESDFEKSSRGYLI